MDYSYFRKVLLSQFFAVVRRPWLLPQLFLNKKEDIWINHNAKAWLEKNVGGKKIFEFGCGYSTDFLAGLCGQIISVEDNSDWFKKANSSKKNNKKIILRTKKKDYVSEVSKHGLFDIVYVDGSHREECAKEGWKYLKKGGVLILDDVNSPKHAKHIYDSFTSNSKFKLGGLKSNTGGYWETGFVFKE